MNPSRVGTAARLTAAAAILVGGLVHLQLYFDVHHNYPNQNLGRSFIANGVASALIAAALVVRRDWFVRLAGIALVVGTLAAFALSRTDIGIFGLTETGLQPSPQGILVLVSGLLAIVLLAATFLRTVGAGRDVEPRVALPAAAIVVIGTAVLSVLWNRSPVAPADSPSEGGGVGPNAVGITDFTFVEPTVTVTAGDTVTWTNHDPFAHTVVGADDAFESERLEPTAKFEFTFDTVGTYSYICGIHPSMAGTVVVD